MGGRKMIEKLIRGAISRLRSELLFDLLSRDSIYYYSNVYLACNKVKGSYFHFGAGSGLDFITAYKQFSNPLFHYYLFDSFQGLPEPEDTLNGKYHKGKYSFSKDCLFKKLHKNRIPAEKYTIVEGYFKDIPLKDLNEKAAFVILDCDIYESTFDALKFVKPYLQAGTIICAAEYFNYKADCTRGMAGAINYFFNDELVKWRSYGESGMAFIYTEKNH